MRIGQRVERLERSSPPLTAKLINRIEREAMNALSREEQRILTGYSNIKGSAAVARYHEALSNALQYVSDDDLNRMILFYEPHITLGASTA